MQNSISLILSQTAKFSGSTACDSKEFENLVNATPLQKLTSEEIANFNLQIEKNEKPGKAVCQCGFSFPFQPNIFRKIMSIQFEDPYFIILYVLNSYISWIIFFERIQSVRYIDEIITTLCDTNIIANNLIKAKKSQVRKSRDSIDPLLFPELTSNSFFLMYSMLLDSKIYQFGELFFTVFEKFISYNISRSNMIFKYLCQTIAHIIEKPVELNILFKLISSTVKLAAANNISVDSHIIDNIIKAIANLLIEMNTEALRLFEQLIPLCNIKDHDFIFNQISVTIVRIILDESETMEWPTQHAPVVRVDAQIGNTLSTSVTNRTFKGGLPKLIQFPIERDSYYASFCTAATLDKISLFLTSISDYESTSVIFVKSLFDEVAKYKELEKLPQVYSLLIFVCQNLLSSLSNFQAAVFLAKSAIFDPSISVFDSPEHFKTISRLRLETITISIKQGADSFNDFMTYISYYPKLTAEVFYRMIGIHSLYYLLIKQDPRAILGLVHSLNYYTQLHITEKGDVEEIERTRTAQFTFLQQMLSKKSIGDILYQDMEFANLFVSFIFENALRQFILATLLQYFKIADPNELNYVIGPLVTVFANTKNDFLNPDFLSLIHDTVVMLSELHHTRKGISSVVGPIHEGINIMIHLMPPNSDTEKILFTCINLFTEAGDENMLTAESMTMLSESIINFYKGNPTSGLYHKLIQLFIGDTSSEQKPEFEIKNRTCMNLLYQVFINSTHSTKLLDFFSKLFDFKSTNCIIAHKVKFDLLLCQTISDFRSGKEDDIEKLDKVLHLFKQITIHSTSQKVISSYLSNLAPVSVSKYHNRFVRCLYDIIYAQYQSFNLSFFLNNEKSALASSFHSSANSFVFWLSLNIEFDGKNEIMEIHSQGLIIKVLINNNKMSIFIDNNKMSVEIGPVTKLFWHFVCITIECNENKFKISTTIDFQSNVVNYTIENTSQQETYVSLKKCDAEISYVAIFPPIKHEYKSLYSLGPFTVISQQQSVLTSVQKPKIAHEMKDLKIPEKSISSILAKKSNFLPLIKFAKSAASDTESTVLYVSIFTKLMSFNKEGQEKFLEISFMQSFSHSLREKPSEFLSYEFYLSLYNFFISMTNIELKDAAFKYILTEPLIWNKAQKTVHEMIVNHWARVLYKSYMPRAAEIRNFSQLFEHFSSNFSKLSRASYQSVLITVASEEFTISDFTMIIACCSAANNEELEIYLLQFLNILMLEIPEKFKAMQMDIERISAFQLLINNCSPIILPSVIESIVQFERLTDDSHLVSHLDAILYHMVPEKCTDLFCQKIADMLMTDTPELLSMNCWACVHCQKYDQSTLKNALESCEPIKKGAWMFWPLVLAIRVTKMSDSVIKFLFRVTKEKWYTIIPNAFATCSACDVKCEEFISDVLFSILGQKFNTQHMEFADIIDVVTWYISHNDIPSEDSLFFTMLKQDKSGMVVLNHNDFATNSKSTELTASPLSVHRTKRFKRKGSVYQNNSGNELSLYRTESADVFLGFNKKRVKKGPESTIAINDLKRVVLGNDQAMIKFGMRVDANGVWMDLSLAISLCDYVTKICEASQQSLSDETVDKIVWTLVYIARYDTSIVKRCISAILPNKDAQTLAGIYKVTSTDSFRKLHEAPQRSDLVEEAFETETAKLRKTLSKFFDVLLPKFTKGVMHIISEYDEIEKARQRYTRQIIEECSRAHTNLLKML